MRLPIDFRFEGADILPSMNTILHEISMLHSNSVFDKKKHSNDRECIPLRVYVGLFDKCSLYMSQKNE
jgi:uncharacterized protein YehS (DUF1456 family)